MAKQTKPQKETVERVMHEFKEGDLRIRGTGPKVKNPKQAIAIALHEAGATNQESPKKNRENLRRTRAKEAWRHGPGRSRTWPQQGRRADQGPAHGRSRAARAGRTLDHVQGRARTGAAPLSM